MKYLRQFEYFDWNGFAKHKRFMTVGISPLTDRETKEIIGTRQKKQVRIVSGIKTRRQKSY